MCAEPTSSGCAFAMFDSSTRIRRPPKLTRTIMRTVWSAKAAGRFDASGPVRRGCGGKPVRAGAIDCSAVVQLVTQRSAAEPWAAAKETAQRPAPIMIFKRIPRRIMLELERYIALKGTAGRRRSNSSKCRREQVRIGVTPPDKVEG